MASQSAFLFGRAPATDLAPGKDRLFAGLRHDGKSVASGRYEHCTFANVSFLKARLEDIEFIDCAFLSCYFRRAEIYNVRVIGCKFINCDFPHLAITGSVFKYCRFSNCYIDFAEMQHNMPSEANIREDLSRNLTLECAKLGASAASRRYRFTEIEAHETLLWNAVKGEGTWYKKHYPGVRRFTAFIQYVGSVVDRHLWGYGERPWILLRNFVALTIIVFPIIYASAADQFRPRPEGGHVSISQCILFSADRVLTADPLADIVAQSGLMRAVAAAETVCGVAALALFASMLFKRISR